MLVPSGPKLPVHLWRPWQRTLARTVNLGDDAYALARYVSTIGPKNRIHVLIHYACCQRRFWCWVDSVDLPVGCTLSEQERERTRLTSALVSLVGLAKKHKC